MPYFGVLAYQRVWAEFAYINSLNFHGFIFFITHG